MSARHAPVGHPELFRVIDWMMAPEVLGKLSWSELQQYEREKRMPYVTSVERGREEGRESVIALVARGGRAQVRRQGASVC